jgi:threonine synthase
VSGGHGGFVGWRCAVCATTVDIATPYPFTCPRASATDRRHVLHPLVAADDQRHARLDDANPLVAYGPRMAWWAFGVAHGMTEAALIGLAREVGAGFTVTPFAACDLDLHRGARTTVWIKDETGNVGGSHKSRHLAGILLHLRAVEMLGLGNGGRPALAIASCGNAAIAAATLARRVDWPLRVFVPEWASAGLLGVIESCGAEIVVCPRQDDDPPGDPALLRFREAVAAGALPFTVQGPENALCLDAGRTIGWEIADAIGAPGGPAVLDRVVVQVGGGALAACVGWGLGPGVRLDTVQAQGCAPLARAWWRAKDAGYTEAQLPGRWRELMTPWERPQSIADGILDDETYDWLADVDVMSSSSGRPIVVPEEAIVDAAGIAATTGIDVSATGSAALAALLVADGRPAADESVAVIFSGVRR